MLGFLPGIFNCQWMGRASARRPRPAPLGRDLDRYVGRRALAAGLPMEELAGPVFITRTGRRLDQPAVYRLVQRVGEDACVPGAEHLSVHSLRHSVATAGLKVARLHAVQDLLGHARPAHYPPLRRARNSLDRSAAYTISKLVAEDWTVGRRHHSAAGHRRSPAQPSLSTR